MFTSSNGDFDIQKTHINGLGDYVITAGLTNNGILGRTNIPAKVFDAKTITVDMFGFAFYRHFNYKMVTHARVFSLKPNFNISDRQGLFIANSFHFLNKKFGYENMCSWEKIKGTKVKLPIKDNDINLEFMESFVAELEALRVAELKAYLISTGLNDYSLSSEEQKALDEFENIKWKLFNLEALFGKSTRGKRLRSADRISGDLPFVTAGEADEGVSDFIDNNVTIFEKNTTTIDMFGSAKYRNYKYGGDDHIAVVHTEKLEKYASIFVTTSIHKSSHNGQFSYDKNFYAKDADDLNIMLPSKNGTPDYEYMSILSKAVHKLVIKDVVLYADRKIEMAKNIVKGEFKNG